MIRFDRLLLCLGLLLSAASSASGQQDLWTPLALDGTPPSRSDFAFGSDPQSGFFALFGGSILTATFYSDTWIYDGAQTWTEVVTSPSPSARRGAPMAFDPGRGVFVMYGGNTGNLTFFADTWEFNGASWSQGPLVPSPGLRSGHATAYDPTGGEVLIFGGGDNELWGYDGTIWTNRMANTPPTNRMFTQFVYDAGRDVHVLFGGDGVFPQGDHLDDTWEYSSATNTWTQISTLTTPPGRNRHAMAYDPSRGVVVMYGGLGFFGDFNDTWEYDGVNWVQVTTGANPGTRRSGSMVTAPTGLVMHGGCPSTVPVTDTTWAFAGPPLPFPGSGGDCAMFVGVNGSPPVARTVPVALFAGETVTLNLRSPEGTLDFTSFALIASNYVQGSPPPGLPLLGSGPSNVWVDPANAVVILDSLGPPTSIFVPTLVPGGLTLGPFNVPAGLSGQAVNFQVFAADPMASPVFISTSPAVAFEFQ